MQLFVNLPFLTVDPPAHQLTNLSDDIAVTMQEEGLTSLYRAIEQLPDGDLTLEHLNLLKEG
jgi:hypothetical protein